ncbi:MAG: peptidoglycan-binding protein [Sulfurovum sp.]|nr:peptidoglycan-binding protein [Sulfurovum sp.]
MLKIKYSSLLLGILLPTASLYAESVPLTPPDAKPGECYAKVVLPAEYEDIEEQVMVKEPSESISIIPAEYDTVKSEIEVIPETKKLTPVVATYKEVVETIEIKPAFKIWKNSLDEDALPVSPIILSAIESAGVDIKNAQTGDCYREYFVPRKFAKNSEEILVQSESNETEVLPPEFEIVEKTVTIKPASKELVEVAAVYEEIEEQILIAPEKTIWKKGQNPAQKVSGATGEIMCLVTVPAKYKTLKKKILKEPATTSVVDTPPETKIIETKKLLTDYQVKYTSVDAVYISVEKTALEQEAQFAWYSNKNKVDDKLKFSGQQACLIEEPAENIEVTKMVLDTPARIDTEVIPATFEMAETQELIAEAKVVKTPIEADFKTIAKKKRVTDEQIGWKRILCQTNMSQDVIANIQKTLNDKGYEAGEPDGLLGRGTKNAIDQFQRENNLATGGITYDTLGALGIKLSHQQ